MHKPWSCKFLHAHPTGQAALQRIPTSVRPAVLTALCRGIAGTSICLMFTLGEFVLVGLAWALPHWRNLTLAAGLLTAGSLLLFPWVPESAR